MRSMKYGTQPTPDSSRATRSFGCRSRTPPRMSAVDATIMSNGKLTQCTCR